MSEPAFSMIAAGRLASKSRAPLAFIKKMILVGMAVRMLRLTAGHDPDYRLRPARSGRGSLSTICRSIAVIQWQSDPERKTRSV